MHGIDLEGNPVFAFNAKDTQLKKIFKNATN